MKRLPSPARSNWKTNIIQRIDTIAKEETFQSDKCLIFWRSAVFKIEILTFYKMHGYFWTDGLLILQTRNNYQRLAYSAISKGAANDVFNEFHEQQWEWNNSASSVLSLKRDKFGEKCKRYLNIKCTISPPVIINLPWQKSIEAILSQLKSVCRVNTYSRDCDSLKKWIDNIWARSMRRFVCAFSLIIIDNLFLFTKNSARLCKQINIQ